MNPADVVQGKSGLAKTASEHAVVLGPTQEVRSSEASQMQDRLKSHQSAEGSGRSVPDTAPYASQLRLKREALSALLSSKVAPGTILARLKSCKVAREQSHPPLQPPLQVNASLLFAHGGSIAHAAQQQEPPKACMMAVHANRREAVEVAVQRRLAELEQGAPDAQPQIQQLLERKKLQLLGLQRGLRSQVAAEQRLQQDADVARLAEWTAWRRPMPDQPQLPPPPLIPPVRRAADADSSAHQLQAEMQRAKAAKEREMVEQRALAEQERWIRSMQLKAAEDTRRREMMLARLRQANMAKLKEIQDRRNFCQEVIAYHRDSLRPAALVAAKRRMQRNNGVKAWHGREGRRVGREAAARIVALREQNYEEYLRLARTTKDKRLRTLLDKTDTIISDLGLKVAEQRAALPDEATGEEVAPWMSGDVEEAAAAEQRSQNEEDLDAETLHLLHTQRQYYDSVHVIKEKVRQPEMLQNGTLRAYQLGGVKFLLSLYNNRINGILADEMGLGKTIQTIATLALLQEAKHNNGPHLILAPKATLSNWMNEFAKWAPSMGVVLYDGGMEERKAIRMQHLDVPAPAFNVLVTHYDLIIRDKNALKKVQWEMLVVDEGHRLKNAESKLAEILRTYTFKHRVLLTGTPIQNSLAELWALLNFVLPQVFNSSETFDEWFAAPFKGQGEDMAVQLNEEEQLLVITRLHQVLRPFMLRRTKREVETELPGKTEHILRCDLSAWQRLWYRQIAEEGRVAVDSRAARSLRNSAMHLRKACNHPYLFLAGQQPPYEPGDPEELVRASGKLHALDNILPKLRATGHRVLLFSQMTRALDVIQDYLDLRAIPHLRLDGTTKSEDRARMLADFNAENSPYFIFLLSTRAGGLGLNLQSADTVLMFDSDWNPQMDLQAGDRAHRIGQKKAVLVLVLVAAGTIEEAILDRAQQKRDIDAKVIQAGMFNDESTHKERVQVLQSLMAKGTSDVGSGVHTPREINQLLARNDAEFRTFQQMDREKRSLGNNSAHLMTLDEVPKFVLEPGSGAKSGTVSDEEGLDDIMDPRQRRRMLRNSLAQTSEASDAGANASAATPTPSASQKTSRTSQSVKKRMRQEDQVEPSDSDPESGSSSNSEGEVPQAKRQHPSAPSQTRESSEEDMVRATGGEGSSRGGGGRVRGRGRGRGGRKKPER
ncbi:probable ATP-dependent DNA helicase CHR12 [Coccomyxa sp. Obi]|nr:probable ATP-dependent DNA helicase CHR12 [Coccomyxa sp. Obi]